MPDDLPAAENPAAQPPAPADNDLFGKDSPAPEIKGTARVLAAASSVLDRFGIKRGRGRPRKDGEPKISDKVEIQPGVFVPAGEIPKSSQPATVAVPAAGPARAFDAGLVKRCCSSCLRALTGWADRVLYGKALAVTKDQAFAKNLVTDTTVDSNELNEFSELAAVCLQKYGVGSQYAPEIGLAVIAAGVATRYAVAFKTLDEEIARRRVPATKEEKPA